MKHQVMAQCRHLRNAAQHKVWFITGASRGFGRVWADAALKAWR